MKKIVFCLVLATLVAGGVFAQGDLNATFGTGNGFVFGMTQAVNFYSDFQLNLRYHSRTYGDQSYWPGHR